MKKKLISLLLAAGLLLSALAGCSSSSDDDTDTVSTSSSTKTATITLTAITGKSTTPEAIEQVQEAINKITKSDFKTQVILQLKTEDEYVAYVDAQVEQIEADLAAKEEAEAAAKAEAKAKKEAEKAANAAKKSRSKWTTTTTADTEESTDETQAMTEDIYGREVAKYPELEGATLDILFISGIDMFNDFVEKEYLADLGDELSNDSKILNKYIYPTFLTAGKSGSTQYAIANNRMLGEYTYLLIDKELAAKYELDATSVKSLTDLEEFLDTVKANEPDYAPINAVPDDLNYVQYVNGERGMIGSVIKASYTTASKALPTDLLTNESYAAFYDLADKLNNGGYVDANAEKYAVQVVTGYITSPDDNNWADTYEVVEYEKPIADNDTVYSGMFAVSAYATDISRCMEIVTALNTNAELRNTYAFGVEGVNYEFNKDGTVHMLNDDWSMNFYHCGNTLIGAVPETLPANYAEIAKLQNIETITGPYLGWVYENEDTAATLAAFTPVNDSYLAAFDAATDKVTWAADFKAQFDELKAALKDPELPQITDENLIAVNNMLDSEGDNNYVTSYVDFYTAAYPSTAS